MLGTRKFLLLKPKTYSTLAGRTIDNKRCECLSLSSNLRGTIRCHSNAFYDHLSFPKLTADSLMTRLIKPV
jgi:hypothetical protein